MSKVAFLSLSLRVVLVEELYLREASIVSKRPIASEASHFTEGAEVSPSTMAVLRADSSATTLILMPFSTAFPLSFWQAVSAAAAAATSAYRLNQTGWRYGAGARRYAAKAANGC